MQTTFDTELNVDVPDFEDKPVYAGDTIIGRVSHKDGHTTVMIDPEHAEDFLKIASPQLSGASLGAKLEH